MPAMTILTVTHTTTYRYANPVTFGEHRLMLRPRDSHDLRLLDTTLTLQPGGTVRWLFDVFGNSIGIAELAEPASELRIESSFRAQHYPIAAEAVTIEPYAQRYPFSYPADEIPDLGRTVERHYPDPEHKIDAWARAILEERGDFDTMGLLVAMTTRIKEEFGYSRREEMGTQDPAQTLDTKAGSCRDYALFMMEAARSLGFAARFVSGYLYDEALIKGDEPKVVGSGETHAWVQIYLPGAGWVEFDPTNALVAGRNLIRIAVTRDPTQAVPLAGSFTGATNDYLGMSVEVTVTAEPAPAA